MEAHKAHRKEGAVVAVVEAVDKGGEVGDAVDDREDLWRIDDLLLESHPVERHQRRDDRVEYAPFI